MSALASVDATQPAQQLISYALPVRHAINPVTNITVPIRKSDTPTAARRHRQPTLLLCKPRSLQVNNGTLPVGVGLERSLLELRGSNPNVQELVFASSPL